MQEHQVNLCDLEITSSHGEILSPPEVAMLASFRCTSKCNSLSVQHTSASGAVVLGGMEDGSLVRLRMSLPSLPGASPSAICLTEGDFEETDLVAFSKPHAGPCTCVSAAERTLK